MGKKRNVLLYMDEEIVEKAKKIGLNISQYCENCLKQAIERLEGLNPPKNHEYHPNYLETSTVEPRAGFEPATYGLRNRCST